MMDVKDLRVGNYVKFLGEEREIIGISKTNEGHELARHYIEFKGIIPVKTMHLHPIPLTPEYAEKLGFKYLNSRTKKNTRTWYRDHFFIYFGKVKGPKMNNRFALPYVHNLQNLWWEMKKTPLVKL